MNMSRAGSDCGSSVTGVFSVSKGDQHCNCQILPSGITDFTEVKFKKLQPPLTTCFMMKQRSFFLHSFFLKNDNTPHIAGQSKV